MNDEELRKDVEVNLDRRELLRTIGLTALVSSFPALLAGCGGGGGHSGQSSGGPSNPTGTTVSINRKEISGPNLIVSACVPGQTSAFPIAATANSVVIPISSTVCQFVAVKDDRGRMRGMAVSNLFSGRSTNSSLTVDADSTAVTLIFMTPGIMCTDPGDAATMMGVIRALPTFGQVVDHIRNLQGMPVNTDPTLVQLLINCVNEFIVPGLPPPQTTRPTGAGKTFVFANWTGSANSSIQVQNYGWRCVSLQYAAIDGGNSRTGPVSLETQAMLGAIPGSWSALFTGNVGKPNTATYPFNLSNHTGTTTLQLWVQGPGQTSNSVPLPSDVPSLESAIGWSILFYVVLPVIDFVGATTRGLDLLGSADRINNLLQTYSFSSDALSAIGALQVALGQGDVLSCIALATQITLDILGDVSPILEALGFSGLGLDVILAELALFSGIIGVFNLSVAMANWLALAQRNHTDLGVSYQKKMEVQDEGKGDPPFDWTHQAPDEAVPFGEYRAQLSVGYSNAVGTTVATKTFSGIPLFNLHIMQKMNNSVSVEQGTTVGQVRAILADGTTISTDLVAGVNTAEWGWDRDNQLGDTPKHQCPSTDYPQYVMDSNLPNGGYTIKHFYLRFRTVGVDGPARLQQLELEMYPNGLPSNFGIDIYGMTLEAAVT